MKLQKTLDSIKKGNEYRPDKRKKQSEAQGES